jgi:UDP-glucose 4-epimerase
VLNIASGEGHSLNQIVAAIEALIGRKVAVTYQEGRPFDVPVNVLDIARARAALDWRPALTLEAGLARMRNDLKVGHTHYSSLD